MTLIINIECLYGEFLTVILNAVKLSVIKVSVNILSVMAPLSRFHSKSMLFILALKFKAINPNGYAFSNFSSYRFLPITDVFSCSYGFINFEFVMLYYTGPRIDQADL
jgi:hypothetical protein